MCDVLNHISLCDVIVLAIVLIELDVVNLVGVVLGCVPVDVGFAVAVANVFLLHLRFPCGSSGSVLRIFVTVRRDVTSLATPTTNRR